MNKNLITNQQRNKPPGNLINFDKCDQVDHLGATLVGQKLNYNKKIPN